MSRNAFLQIDKERTQVVYQETAAGSEPGPGLDDEYVFETSYKVQIWPFLSLTPDLQLLLNPAKNPAESSVWVFGLRAILTL